MTSFIERNGRRLRLVDHPQERSLAQEIRWELEQFDPPLGLHDASAWWSLEEASGPRVDVTGHGYDLTPVTLSGALPTNIQGRVGNSVHLLNAGAQYLTLDNPSDDLNLGDGRPFSMFGWGYLDNAGGGAHNFWRFGVSNTVTDTSVVYRAFTLNRFLFTAANSGVGGTSTLQSSFSDVQANTWYAIYAGYNPHAQMATLEIRDTNGAVLAFDTGYWKVGPSQNATSFNIGGGAGFSSWIGRVDEMALFRHELEDEDRQLYCSGITWSGPRGPDR